MESLGSSVTCQLGLFCQIMLLQNLPQSGLVLPKRWKIIGWCIEKPTCQSGIRDVRIWEVQAMLSCFVVLFLFSTPFASLCVFLSLFPFQSTSVFWLLDSIRFVFQIHPSKFWPLTLLTTSWIKFPLAFGGLFFRCSEASLYLLWLGFYPNLTWNHLSFKDGYCIN